MKPQEIIQVNEKNRYALYWAEDYFDYLNEWEHEWGLYSMDYPGRLGKLELDTHGLNSDLAFMLNYRGGIDNQEDNETATAKHLARKGFDCEFIALRGSSQGEWHDVVVYWSKEKNYRDNWDELREWYSGQVFHVALEELVSYYGSNGRHMEVWEQVETASHVMFTGTDKFTLEVCRGLVGVPEVVAA